jgi:hypothetical protein
LLLPQGHGLLSGWDGGGMAMDANVWHILAQAFAHKKKRFAQYYFRAGCFL